MSRSHLIPAAVVRTRSPLPPSPPCFHNFAPPHGRQLPTLPRATRPRSLHPGPSQPRPTVHSVSRVPNYRHISSAAVTRAQAVSSVVEASQGAEFDLNTELVEPVSPRVDDDLQHSELVPHIYTFCSFKDQRVLLLPSVSPKDSYSTLVEKGQLRDDAHQRRIMDRIQRLYHELEVYEPPQIPKATKGGWVSG
jgi:hypothetical protein